MRRPVPLRYKPMLCPPGVPQWDDAMQHAFWEVHRERGGGTIALSEVEQRASEIVVMPPPPAWPSARMPPVPRPMPPIPRPNT